MTFAPEYANWLASYPKSGNTWARLFLNAYMFGALDINNHGAFTLYDCDIHTHNVVSPHPLTDMRPETVIYLRHAALLHMMCGRKYAPTIIKTHSANVEVGGVHMIPKPLTRKAVYLVRDPRDVAVSFARHTGVTVDQAITAMDNDMNMLQSEKLPIGAWISSWSTNVTSWEKDFVTRIRYEDLKENPVDCFSIMLDTFGIKVNKQKVRKAVKLCDINRLKKQEAKAGFFEIGKQDKFFGQGNGWENELTEKQARRIEEDHNEVMKQMGYLNG